MKRIFLFLITCLLPLLPLQAFQLVQVTVLHTWFEPDSEISIPVKGRQNNNVIIRPYTVSTSKEAYIKKYILHDGRTWYALNSTASAEVFYIRGNSVDYDAIAWTELTGDKSILAPPDYTNIIMLEKKEGKTRNYKYGKLEKTKKTTKPDTKTIAKAVKKQHPVSQKKNFRGKDVIRNFYLGDDATKTGGSFISSTGLDADPWAKVTLDLNSNAMLNKSMGTYRSVTPTCGARAAGHTCVAEQKNNTNDTGNTIALDFLTIDNTPDCNLCTDGCSACPTTGACGHTYANSEASNHAWGTAPCGDNTHVGYLCQINASDHDWVYESCPSLHAHYECDGTDHSLQASCSETDSNGNTCTVSSFYACASHTHVYPAPTVSCARQACSQQVSNQLEHR